MDRGELLLAYDEQLREDGEVHDARSVRRRGPVLWAELSHGGFVTYSSLGGVDGRDLDALIGETVAHFRDETDVPRFEWKTRGHDLPADLGVRLVAHGLVAEPVETVMVGEASALAGPDLAMAFGEDLRVRRAGEGGDLRDDLSRMLALQESVFGGGLGPSLEDALADLEPAGGEVNTEFWLAEAPTPEGATVVCAGRLVVVPGTDFAGLWGGATLPSWRGRGIYRALVAARARAAVQHGVRYLHSDCTDMSRPILERAGLVAITTTTPYVWTR